MLLFVFFCSDDVVIVIIALKGAVQDFYNLLTALRTVSNTYIRVARAKSCANHMQHIEHLSCANVVCHVAQRESLAIKFDSV